MLWKHTANDDASQCSKIAQKSRIQHCERSELRIYLERLRIPKMIHFASLKLADKQCYQTGQFQLDKKLIENAKK